jgi:hypothetical protein
LPGTDGRTWLDVPEEWTAAANACDRPADYLATPLSKRYNAAFKVALVALQAGDRSAMSEIQLAFITELISNQESELVSERAAAYPTLLAATKKAAENYQEIAPDVVLTQVDTQVSADITALLFAGYKLAPVAVVQTRSVEDESEITIVGTNDRSRNLVEAFGLGSGNPQRVTLIGGSHEQQLARIREMLN